MVKSKTGSLLQKVEGGEVAPFRRVSSDLGGVWVEFAGTV